MPAACGLAGKGRVRAVRELPLARLGETAEQTEDCAGTRGGVAPVRVEACHELPACAEPKADDPMPSSTPSHYLIPSDGAANQESPKMALDAVCVCELRCPYIRTGRMLNPRGPDTNR